MTPKMYSLIKRFIPLFTFIILIGCENSSSKIDPNMLAQNSGPSESEKAASQTELLEVQAALNLGELTLASNASDVASIDFKTKAFSDANLLFTLPAAVTPSGNNLNTFWLQTGGSAAFIFDQAQPNSQILLPMVEAPEILTFVLYAVDATSSLATRKELKITVLPLMGDLKAASSVMLASDTSVTFTLTIPASDIETQYSYSLAPADATIVADLSEFSGTFTVPAGETTFELVLPITPELANLVDGILKVIVAGTQNNLPVHTTALGVFKDWQNNNSAQISINNGVLSGDGTTGLHQVGSDIVVAIEQASFATDINLLSASINDSPLPLANTTLGSQNVIFKNALNNGVNVFLFSHQDTNGNIISFQTELWAGANTLEVNLLDSNNQPLVGSVDVVLTLADNLKIKQTGNTTTGSFIFENIPSRTVLIEAFSASGNLSGTASVLGDVYTTDLILKPLSDVSEIDNNDLSLGLEGWEFDNPNAVSLIINEVTLDQDIMLTTQGSGAQRLSRTFQSTPGATAVRVRFQFITSEVPEGYFGSEYNDTYSVLIQTEAGEMITDAGSMNGLGLEAFEIETGKTEWKSITLPVSPDGELIQVTLTVTNVGDGSFDSQIVVDFIEELFPAET